LIGRNWVALDFFEVVSVKSVFSKLIYSLGVVALCLIFYVVSFYALRNGLVRPHEAESASNVHWVRPIYNRVYYPLRWFVANGSSIGPNPERVYYGTLDKLETPADRRRESYSVGINRPGSYMIIGYTGPRRILEKVEKIELGSYVKMRFGATLARDRDRFISRLTQVDVIELMDDPRIPNEDYSVEESKQISLAFGHLGRTARLCADQFLDKYRDDVFEHCTQAGYAQNTAGGCHHIVGRAITTSVQRRAIDVCTKFEE
jgi:hypothetical protein